MMRLACALLAAAAMQQAAPPAATPPPFHWHDDYTEYHLLAPGTHQFHIVYLLNQRQPGLTYVLNQTRSGSEGSGISVSDPRTGAPLKFDYLTGKELAEQGVRGRLNAGEHYIRAHLPRPVPSGGEGRVRIEKTYKDEKSYFGDGETITFARSLGIGRNAIILPAGYKLVSSNVSGIVESLEDGRLRVSFENINSYASDVTIRAAKSASATYMHFGGGRTPASDVRKTLYELRADGILAITHQFLASGPRPAVFGNYGPAASMRAFDMDLGRDVEITPPASREEVPMLAPASEKVLTSQIRITNTFNDPKLVFHAQHLEWSRDLNEPRSTIVLPPGYELSQASMPVTMGTLADGRVYLQVVNNRPASVVRLEIRARK